jgi:4'-phosphopantetheinyl transferase
MDADAVRHLDATSIDVIRIRLDSPARPGCADGRLREILAHYLGADSRGLSIVRDPNGKPVLQPDVLAFNVSHSGDLALIAVSRVGPLGIDVERERAEVATVDLARRYFTRSEAALVEANPRTFFRIWTRKEAWAKAQGLGLAIPLDAVDVSGAVSGWFVADLEVGFGFSAAVARPGEAATVRLRDELP